METMLRIPRMRMTVSEDDTDFSTDAVSDDANKGCATDDADEANIHPSVESPSARIHSCTVQ